MSFIHRRRYKTLVYPTSIEEYVGDPETPKYLRDGYREDYAGFTARVLASPNGAEERALSQARLAYYISMNPKRDDEGKIVALIDPVKAEAARNDYCREIAWRIPEWSLEEENRDGDVVKVPAPGESDDNWQALEMLPATVMWWLIEEVRDAHKPDPLLPGSALTTDTPTPSKADPVMTLLPSSESPSATG